MCTPATSNCAPRTPGIARVGAGLVLRGACATACATASAAVPAADLRGRVYAASASHRPVR
eukprot:CAMPEP_0113696720 /NCGR_PEP_ID=MMETSP0038_2-20120614/21678_1 /TAXON_ID=2898 /ORGANISM="Cryptomonas paramecium" /LENGTH=60 /DNA_ID=CAMNT_0000619537 /DNA_START=235 /DNA_END=413 /DNA_ORIENTATION=+ /assembly_acc=CAM_ASM_000170